MQISPFPVLDITFQAHRYMDTNRGSDLCCMAMANFPFAFLAITSQAHRYMDTNRGSDLCCMAIAKAERR